MKNKNSNVLLQKGLNKDMQSTGVYQYTFLSKDQTKYVQQAVECLTQTFVGMKVDDKLVQEPVVTHLQVSYESWYVFTENYINDVIEHGYCAVAIEDDTVVGVLVGDTNKPILDEYFEYQSFLSRINALLYAAYAIERRFMEDYEKRYGEVMQEGEILHIFMLGIRAKNDRHEIVKHLTHMLLQKAKSHGLKLAFAEATNPKSMKLLERYSGILRYRDVNGNYIVHNYKEDKLLNGIPKEVADGMYIVARELSDYEVIKFKEN